MTGDPKVLAGLQQAFNASDIYHVKRYIGYAWEKETDTVGVVAPPLDDRIRAWTPPDAEPSLEQRVAELETMHAELIDNITAGLTRVDHRIRAITHPEPTAPDLDPVRVEAAAKAAWEHEQRVVLWPDIYPSLREELIRNAALVIRAYLNGGGA